MLKKLTLEELIASNPSADADKLRESQRVFEELKAAGFEGAQYNVATPLTGNRRDDHNHRVDGPRLRQKHDHKAPSPQP